MVLYLVHPFPLRGNSPQGETRDMKRKTGESYASCTTPAFPPLVAGATIFPPRWEACHWTRGSRGSPMNPVPLPPPQFGGAAKGKRLNGQARRLTSPHLEVLCRTSTGALWVLSNGAMSLQKSIERFILSPGWGGKGTRFVREQSDLRIV